MTLQEIMDLAFVDAGEPTDLCPYVDSSNPATFDTTFAIPQAVRLRNIVNMAQTRIANWRFRSGRQLYHRGLVKTMIFDLKPMTGVIGISGTAGALRTTVVVELPQAVYREDFFSGWMLEATTSVLGVDVVETSRILSSSSMTATDMTLELADLLDTTPDATTTFKLWPNGLEVVPFTAITAASAYQLEVPGGSMDVMKVMDYLSGSILATVNNTEFFTSVGFGTISQYKRIGRKIFFDSFSEDPLALEIVYRANPVPLTAATQIPELEEPFHQAIAQWATHDIMRRNADYNGAYATKREVEDLLEMLYIQSSSENLMEQGGVTAFS